MYQQDSEFVHWVLGGDPFYHSAYNSDMIQHDAGVNDIHHRTYYSRSHTDTQSSQIENDELIARALQEEFSHLAVADASEFSHSGEQQFQASIEPHYWHSPSTKNYYQSGGRKFSLHTHFISLVFIGIILSPSAGYEYGQDESDDLVPPSSCSSPSDSEDCSCSWELTDGFLLDDDEVGKRLNQMIPIPVRLPYKNCRFCLFVYLLCPYS